MNCDMCGNEAELFRASIEGAFINACSKCAKFGKIIGKVSQEHLVQKKAADVPERKDILVITPNFSKLIKQGREKLNLKQEELAKSISEKVSLIHKLETGAVAPRILLAKKLESFLKIKLIEEFHEEKEQLRKGKTADLTLGDFVKVKKK